MTYNPSIQPAVYFQTLLICAVQLRGLSWGTQDARRGSGRAGCHGAESEYASQTASVDRILWIARARENRKLLHFMPAAAAWMVFPAPEARGEK